MLRIIRTTQQRRFFVKVGEAVPINYIKDKQNPVIKKDEEYPSWVFKLTEKLPAKNVLLEKLNTKPEEMSEYELRRLKRLITLDDIREANSLKVAEK